MPRSIFLIWQFSFISTFIFKSCRVSMFHPDKYRRDILPVLGGSIAICFVLFAMIQGGRNVAGELGDGRFTMFVLEHVYRWLIGQEESLLSPPIFFPYPYTLGFSDTHAGSALVYAVFRSAGLDQYHALNAWIAAGYLTTFLSAYYALRRLSLMPVIASIGAFAFACSLPSIVHIGHSQLIYRVGTPLAFLFAWEFARSKSPNDLLKFVAACSVQLLMNVYTGMYTVLLCGLFMLVSGVYFGFTGEGGFGRLWRDARSAWVRSANYRFTTLTATALLVSFALAVLLFHVYVSHLYGLGRSWAEIEYQVARLRSYFILDYLPYWAPVSETIQGLRQRNEHQLFLGVPLVVLFIAMLGHLLWRRREASPQLKIFALSILATGLLMTSFLGHTLYWFIGQLPGFDALRAAARYEIILVFPLVVAVGLYLQQLLRTPSLRVVGTGAIAVWAAWSLADVVLLKKTTVPISDAKGRIEAAAAAVPAGELEPNTVIAYGADFGDHPALVQINAMLLAQSLGVSTLNGYSGNSPLGYSYNPSCIGFMRQLAAYDEWASRHDLPRLSEIDYHPFFVQTNGCNLDRETILQLPITAGDPLTKQQGDAVGLRLRSVTAEPDSYKIALQIVNESEHTIHALSSSPFRLSWRVTKPGETSREGWDTRHEIEGDIRSGESLSQTLVVPRSAVGPGKAIQVTFVVEGKFWAHDIGIPPLEVEVPE